MELGRPELAIGRLERALSRIEAALANNAGPATVADVALRQEVAATIAHIDQLLRTADGGPHD